MSDAEHKPYVSPEQNIRELTIPAVVMGAVLGVVFAASSVYLGLKVGLTVSASIPVAVLSITLFRWFGMKGTILENNIAQTTGSAGESLAAGVAFTLPSLLIMGFEVELIRILLVALFGGLIGVLMLIPLRHGLIVKEHGKLAYPEGEARGGGGAEGELEVRRDDDAALDGGRADHAGHAALCRPRAEEGHHVGTIPHGGFRGGDAFRLAEE